MSEVKRGIKRHESLYPLSHHHHHALFLALKLKRSGTEKAMLANNLLKNELIWFWENSGQQHFRDEEEILLPHYAIYGSLDREEIREMLLEHVQIRSLIFQIEKSDPNSALFQELGELLEEHVRKEERVIFPFIEEALPDGMLEDLAPLLK